VYVWGYVNINEHTPICSVNDHDLLCDGAYTSETMNEMKKIFNVYFNSNYQIKIQF
jgi:hypothetical protein